IHQKDFDNRLRKIEIYPDLNLPLHSELAKWITDIQNGRIWDFDNNVAISKDYAFLNLENGGTGWNWSTVAPIFDTDGNTIAEPLPDSFLQIGQPGGLSIPAERPNRFSDPDFFVGVTGIPGDSFVETVVSLSKNQSVTISDPYGAVANIKAGTPITEHSVVSDPGNSVQHAKDMVSKKTYPKPLGSNFGPVDTQDINAITQANTSTISNNPDSNAFAIPAATTTNRPAPIVNVDDRPVPQRIAAYGPIVAIAAKKFNVPFDLVMAHIEAETGGPGGNSNTKNVWKATLTSPAGARGLGQIEPKTGVGLGVSNPSDLFDPVTNMFTTARYISQLRKIFANHPDGERLAIAAYNAGPGIVKKAGFKIPTIPETQNYVANVIRFRAHYKIAGSSTPGLDLTGTDDATNREARQLFGQFKQGYGYNLRDIFPYMILGSGKPANSSQAFNPKWFRKVLNTSTGDTFMVVWAVHLARFIEAERKYQVFPKLVKIPEVLPGKNLYDHTANSVAVDEKNLNDSLLKGNPFAALPRFIAGQAAALGAAAVGGSALDQTHAEAEAVRRGISLSDV
ncbi:MAG TPA: lytic transglycosylase domain-containing protein, partial [Methylomirabilota bacterium]|nr:lytic transglycosylase domain-containing protein [Methylomirabilota bacterium]